MAENSKIEWTDHTVNFWWGCAKVSPACANCYAEGQAARFHAGLWGPQGERRIRLEAARQEAMRYERRAAKEGRRFRVFTNSMADFFEDRADLLTARLEALDIIRQTPRLDWLILTKRPEAVHHLLARASGDALRSRNYSLATWIADWGTCQMPPPNVWLGTTVEDQARADQRIPALLQVPAHVRFLSCEPLLAPVDLDRIHETFDGGLGHSWESCLTGKRFSVWDDGMADGFPRIDWVICGGESGPKARPMHPDWARGLRDQCAAAGVPFLFKQHGEWAPDCLCATKDPHPTTPRPEPGKPGVMFRCGKKAAGRLLDGRTWDELPGVRRD